jgi:rare lipoprotein A
MKRLFLALACLVLGGCGSTSNPGGYYKDDGPHERPPANLDRVADAVPRTEPLHKFANRPYNALGKQYVPMTSLQPFRERGLASWYGKRYHGRKTSSGEVYDMYQMTAAHPTLPIPSYARVTSTKNGKSVVVRINDRGPFRSGRVIDLSYVAAHKLGYIQAGEAMVEVESIVPGRRAGL